MIDSLPTVQRYRRVKRIVRCSDIGDMKRAAHRRRRRQLRRISQAMALDPARFDGETFETKSLSSWDIA